MRTILFSLMLLGSYLSYSQSEKDSILLLNGKVYEGTFTRLDKVDKDSVMYYETVDNQGGKTEAMFALYRVFSYTKGGVEKIVYEQNEFKGNYLSISETKAATYGSYDARQTFKPYVPMITSYALGLGASLFDTYLSEATISHPNYAGSETSPGFLKRDPSLLPVLVPIVISVSWGLPSFKLKDKKIIHKEYFNDANFYRGYHRVARQKRMIGSLIGGFSGLATGMIAYYIAAGI